MLGTTGWVTQLHHLQTGIFTAHESLRLCMISAIQEIVGSSLSLEMWFLTVVLVWLRPCPLPPHSQQFTLHWLLSHYVLLYSLSDVNPPQPSGHCKYHQFNINQFYVLFCVDLRTNSNYFTIQHYLVGCYNFEGVCLLCDTDWMFNYN
jgi:hypothetical protein